MKTITALIIVICLAGASVVQAQTEKGHWLIGASTRTQGLFSMFGADPSIMNLGFSTWNEKDDSGEEDYKEKYISINMSPRFGYFVVKNLAIGLDMNLAVWKDSWGDEYETSNKISFFTAGPFVRFYIPAGKVYPFFEAGAAFGSQGQTYTSDGESDEPTKSSVKCYGGGAGVAVPLGKKVTFDTMISYNSLNTKDKEDNPDNERTIIGTFGIKFGFHIYLGK
jgi:hypothetical protein